MYIGFLLVCMAGLLIKDLFSLYVAASKQCINLDKLTQFDGTFVFAATLLLVTSTLHSEAEKLGLSDLYII